MKSLTKEELILLLNVINQTAFKGEAVEMISVLKQKIQVNINETE